MANDYLKEYKIGKNEYAKLFDKYEFTKIGLSINDIHDKDFDPIKFNKLKDGIYDYLKGKNGKDKKKDYVASMEKIINDIKAKCLNNVSEIAKNVAELFCQMKLNDDFDYNEPAVYIWTIKPKGKKNVNVVYVGETSKFLERIKDGYGHITPRNVFKGGQSTNCKMNYVVREKNDKDNEVRIYYMKCKTRKKAKEIEKELIVKLNNEEVYLYNYQNNKLKILDEK